MKRTLSLLAALMLVPVAAFTAAETPASNPNGILVPTDDQGCGDLSCTGDSVLKTLNVDRLAAESVDFTDSHLDAPNLPMRARE